MPPIVLIQKFTDFIDSSHLISPGDKICVALSGGADSVCLLHLLIQIKKSYRLSISALHINHGTRGKESDEDERFCRDLCSEWGVPFSHNRLKGFDKDASEEDLRDARYGLFEEHLATTPGLKMATGHTLNDQLETFLMRLFHGSGPRGLAAIPLKRAHFIRPLLFADRGQIEHYLARHAIHFRTDQSNLHGANLRSSMRRALLPVIEDVFVQPLENFKTSHHKLIRFLEDYRLLLQGEFRQNVEWENNVLLLPVDYYKSQNSLRQRLLLDYCVLRSTGLNWSLSEKQFQDFDAFARKSQGGGQWFLGKACRVVKDRVHFRFLSGDTKEAGSAELFADQFVNFGGFRIGVHSVDAAEVRIDNNPDIEYICGDNLSWPLRLRTWQKGDFFYPLGMNTRQKVSDFFVNNKVSTDRKKNIPLLLNGGEIVWIGAFRIDNRYKWNKSCSKTFKLTIEEI